MELEEQRRSTTTSSAPPRSFRLGAEALVLHALDEATVNLALWRRTLPPGLSTALTAWAQHPRSTIEGDVDPADCDLGPAVAEVGDHRWRAWLLRDLERLVDLFVAIARPRRLQLSFGPVVTAQCSKFHVDWMRYRLVTTYTGPGTEWLSNEQVRREVLDAPHQPDFHQQLLRGPARAHQAGAGDVVLMKGGRHGGLARGAVHRSPPVDHPAQARVVLVLSAAEEAPRSG